MFYIRNTKQLMGIYFKWCRTKEKTQIKEIIQSIKCSYRTYKDIEDGITKRNDEYYEKLKKYYNIQFCDDYALFYDSIELLSSLYEAVENNEHDLIIEIIEKINKKIIIFKDYAFYKELYDSITIIKEYYIDNKYLSLEEINYVVQLIDLWDNECSSILLEICEKSNLSIHYNYEISDKLYNSIVIRDAISKYWYARECVMHMNYITALNYYKECKEYFDEKNNLHRKVLVMLKEFEIYRDIDQEKAMIYIKELSDMLENNISDVLKKNISYSIAMFYYYQEKYEDALYYYKFSYKYRKRLACLLFIYSCESRINQLQIEDKEIDKDSDYSLYINYFEQKANNTDKKILEKYIMITLLPILGKERYKEPLWNMFEYELRQLVKKTRNYKNLKTFIEKMQLFTKSAL